MLNNDWINDKTAVQVLLDAEAQLSNIMYHTLVPAIRAELTNTRSMLHRQIECLRGPDAPACYGQDDCSSSILSRCPWRMTCGDQ